MSDSVRNRGQSDADENVAAMHREMNKRHESRTDAAIRTLAYNCAGIGAGAIMEQAPTVAMPTEQIQAAVDALLLARLGIDPA